MVAIWNGIVQAIRDGTIYIDKHITFDHRVRGIPPKQHRRIPWVSRSIRIMEILENIATHDPIVSSMRADPVEIADAGAMVVRRPGRIFKPGVLHAPVVHAEACVYVGGV